jgi:hypothetical protein
MTTLKALGLVLVLQFVKLSVQDIYMSNPRGSNNRLNEASGGRANNNRLFDSQNNNAGGYNVGDRGSEASKTEAEQYQMKYFQSGLIGQSQLTVEWTHQHGCGSGTDTNCNIVLQYMCDDGKNQDDRLRDGLVTTASAFTTRNDNETKQDEIARKKADNDQQRGLHESWQHYGRCRYRDNNKGLFLADRNLAKNAKGYVSATQTRQNNNGGRSGYECAEERDYYPYWHPHPWKDIAVLTSNISPCDYYKKNSFNVKPLHECIEFFPTGEQKTWSRWNNQNDCDKNKGKWTEFYNYLEKAPEFKARAQCEAQTNNQTTYKWAVPVGSENFNNKECLVLLKAPECKQAAGTRSNHLGNTREGVASQYVWTLPYFPSKTVQKCVFRIRYNISTDDYNVNLDFKSNQKNNAPQVQSPVRNNPVINFAEPNATKPINIRMAINTAQFGRTFQDRSHTFFMLPRGSDIPDSTKVINLNVRGKRGNIVQTFPAVEYDFMPNDLSVKTNEIVHVQWTGSNTNPAGNAGQGKAGSDRSNIVQLRALNVNYPLPVQQATNEMWSNAVVVGVLDDSTAPLAVGQKKGSFLRKNLLQKPQDLALYFATSGYYECHQGGTCGDKSAEVKSAKVQLDQDLNVASASLPGVLLKFKEPNKTYFYMSSRNNAFTNRAQKAVIKVVA